MKKLLIFLMILSLFSFCGCSNSVNKMGAYSVAAIGFENDEKGFSLYVEAVVVNSENSDAPIKKLLFSGQGKTLEKAYEQATVKSAKPFSLGHCAVLVLSSDINEKAIEEIFDFCLGKRDITVSVSVVKSENVKKILSLDSFSSVAIGYDMVSILQTQYSERKIAFSNRLYEVQPRKSEYVLKTIPEFSDYNGLIQLKGR